MLQRVISLKSDEIVTDAGNFAPSDLQLQLRQWGIGNVYLLVLSKAKR